MSWYIADNVYRIVYTRRESMRLMDLPSSKYFSSVDKGWVNLLQSAVLLFLKCNPEKSKYCLLAPIWLQLGKCEQWVIVPAVFVFRNTCQMGRWQVVERWCKLFLHAGITLSLYLFSSEPHPKNKRTYIYCFISDVNHKSRIHCLLKVYWWTAIMVFCIIF